ncbi:TPA: hypothetical protein U2M43_003688 [Providencia stuartii]|nr:hypothetical protein [Providencia stuartii]
MEIKAFESREVTKTGHAKFTDADVYRMSEDHFLTILPQSKSKNYAMAYNLASKVENIPILLDGAKYTLSLYDISNLRECELLSKVIKLANMWKGFFIAYKGVTISQTWGKYDILSCIKNAHLCVNPKANCLQSVKEFDFLIRKSYWDKLTDYEIVVPCKQLKSSFVDLNTGIPINEQYQSHAAAKGLIWCPYFDMSNFKIVPDK